MNYSPRNWYISAEEIKVGDELEHRGFWNMVNQIQSIGNAIRIQVIVLDDAKSTTVKVFHFRKGDLVKVNR